MQSFGDLKFEDIIFEIVKSPKRRTISIAIHPNRVIIRTPKRTSDVKIHEVIALRKEWILTKMRLIQSNQKPSKTDYIKTGIFHFLGKEYVLKFVQNNANQMLVLHDKILVYHKNENGETLFEKWINKQALEIFTQRLAINFDIFSKKFPHKYPILKIRKMKSRWGSMTSKGVMTLNRNLIHMDFTCIDYVIMHELCHLIEQNHSGRFYKLQEIFVPNWRELKKRF